MLGLDEAVQLRWARQAKREKAAELRAQLLAEEIKSNEVTVAPDNGVDVTNALAQMGRPLASDAIIAKLKLCNSHLRFERSNNFPDLIGIYILDKNGRHTIKGEKVKHLMGMEARTMPEFTVIHETAKDIPDPDNKGQWKEVKTYAGQTRGWRTLLVRLLHAELITRGDVDKYFGWAPSRDSEFWHRQTQ